VTIILSVGMLLLAVAVVVLFAMLGELASRLPRSSETEPWTATVAEAAVGASPTEWPQELAEFADAEHSLLLVLSTACNSCISIAGELEHVDTSSLGKLGVILSTGSSVRGKEFASRYRLDRFSLFIDENGAWVGREFAVNSSPTALSLIDGRLESANTFSGVPALRGLVADHDVVSRESGV